MLWNTQERIISHKCQRKCGGEGQRVGWNAFPEEFHYKSAIGHDLNDITLNAEGKRKKRNAQQQQQQQQPTNRDQSNLKHYNDVTQEGGSRRRPPIRNEKVDIAWWPTDWMAIAATFGWPSCFFFFSIDSSLPIIGLIDLFFPWLISHLCLQS